MPHPSSLCACLSLTALLLAGQVAAQSICTSDGQPVPGRLSERFISADCADCWSASDIRSAPTGTLALDWIVPGRQGEDAPLSAAALRDAQDRLQALQMSAPAASASSSRALTPMRRLRVARGLPVSGYMGVSIELKPARAFQGRWRVWLAMVESVPAGSSGTPVARLLVRNVLQLTWDGQTRVSRQLPRRFYDSRPMTLPEGVAPERLGLVGWVEDERGRLVAMAATACASDFGR